MFCSHRHRSIAASFLAGCDKREGTAENLDSRQLRPDGLASRANELAAARTPITKIIRQPVASTSPPTSDKGICLGIGNRPLPLAERRTLLLPDVAAQTPRS